MATVMSTYKIEICETFAMVVPVIAETLDTALERVQEAYSCGEIELSMDGHYDITFKQV